MSDGREPLRLLALRFRATTRPAELVVTPCQVFRASHGVPVRPGPPTCPAGRMVEGHQGRAVLALGLTQGRPQVQRQTEAEAKEERDKLEAFEGRREVEHLPLSVDDNSPRIMSRHCGRAHTGRRDNNILLYLFGYRQICWCI